VQPTGGLKGFATRPIGRVILIAVAIVTVAFGLIYLGEVLGIAILLLFGLGLPIYMGMKRPRSLAIGGIVILLIAAPIAAVLVTELYFQPPGATVSLSENGRPPVLTDATVTPFSAASGQLFTFHVTIIPSRLYPNTTLRNLTFFVSTCPGATGPNETQPLCSVPYPSHQTVTHLNLTAKNSTTPETLTAKLAGPNLWWWIAYATYYNSTSPKVAHYIWLNPNNGYSAMQGPVAGDFLGILGIVILPVYEQVLLYPGIAFFAALAFYAWFKQREARRRGAAFGGPRSTDPLPPVSAASEGATKSPEAESRPELHCPKCRAVVYATERQCWKCGTALGSQTSASTPLNSGGPPTRPS
jgi:hypothetical protein